MARALEPQRRLLAVYTGGTIGMRSEQGVLVPGSGLAAVLRSLPMFHDEEYARACGLPEDTLVLPPAIPDQRVIYTVLECQPLFDSSDMTITEWVQIAQTIERHYGQYDGFVVIHGTDTMAFAASVLSFVLENLQKTVILTGAQVPIHALWNDSRENLLGALLMAGQYVIPEVCLFFQNQLFRGNRVTKVDSRRFAAFCSPHLPPLAVMGTDVTINWELVRKARGKAQLVVHSSMERDVGLLRLYPGIPAALVRAFLQPPLKGVVMETFGSGNGPTKPDLLRELRAAAERGLIILNCSHCLQGAVTSDYAAGMAMAGAGIVSGFDMTSEAALAKLSYVLGHPGLTPDDRKEEADAIREALVPSLACAAAHAGDLEVLQGSDLSLESFNGQTPLHAAARGGQPGAVTMLLRRGVDVDPRDEDGLSPLLLAVKGRHRGVIELLRAAGACLSLQELEDAGTELCRLAARADLEGLQSWWQAGADLSSPGYDGRSALLVAEAAGNLEVVTFLQNLKGGAGVQAPGPATL
ncbi:60 kDa lysophospholipase isoform X8 [Lutra lutra]|uniref:60 kDa lysophospholipase isoform X8 n=1 Tax=Lutra lutra TaxID=9657 RepID=UPI001FD20AE8|nr:60 kDa lysophospholipase isoform X8 [Lutra lutra]